MVIPTTAVFAVAAQAKRAHILPEGVQELHDQLEMAHSVSKYSHSKMAHSVRPTYTVTLVWLYPLWLYPPWLYPPWLYPPWLYPPWLYPRWPLTIAVQYIAWLD